MHHHGCCGVALLQLDAATEDLMLHFLCLDPEQRMGSQGGIHEIMAHPFFEGVDVDEVISQAAADRDLYDPL
jgi:hypothetical protein